MTLDQEAKLVSILQTLSTVSYNALIENLKLKNEWTPEKEKEIKDYQDKVDENIEELFK